MGLREYKKKRDFKDTTEPAGKVHTAIRKKLSFVIQEHHATRLHFDFRLEMEGILRSWAVPKGPSMNPNDKRLAMMVEDHPLEYGSFQGTIPEGNYGAGEVRIWDKGHYTPLGDDSPEKQVRNQKIIFTLHGKKLKGEFHLFRMKGSREENAWLLFKAKDKYADPKWKMEQILSYGSRREKKPEGLTSKKVWISNRAAKNEDGEKPKRSTATKALLKASKEHSSAETKTTKKLAAKSTSRTSGRTKAATTRKAKAVTNRKTKAGATRSTSVKSRTRKVASSATKRTTKRSTVR